jgi:hypothetical protein
MGAHIARVSGAHTTRSARTSAAVLLKRYCAFGFFEPLSWSLAAHAAIC